jgi:hypothetical protein
MRLLVIPAAGNRSASEPSLIALESKNTAHKLHLVPLKMHAEMFGWLLLVAFTCFGWHAFAQQPTSPGMLAVGQVFTGQYDDFTTFGDKIVIKIATSESTVLRLNGIGLHLYYPYYNYRALPRSFEGQLCLLAPRLCIK